MAESDVLRQIKQRIEQCQTSVSQSRASIVASASPKDIFDEMNVNLAIATQANTIYEIAVMDLMRLLNQHLNE